MSKGNLLLIDDEVLLLQSIKDLLSKIADQIFTAENGADGLKILASQKIDCIICDINMPKMNGLEVIKKVRESKIEVPFIFYTAHGSEKLMMEAIKYGAFDFINKMDVDYIEEVAQRGLKAGLKSQNSSVANSEDLFMSEYSKLLQQTDIKK